MPLSMKLGRIPFFLLLTKRNGETVKETSSMMSDQPCAISLPDLFAGSLPKKTAAPEAVPLTVPALRLKKSRNNRKKRKKKGRCPSSVVPSMKEIFTWSF